MPGELERLLALSFRPWEEEKLVSCATTWR